MSNVWPSSDLFELMEGLDIIETRGKLVRLRPKFTDFAEGLDSQKVNLFIKKMIKEGFFPEPETEEMRRGYFFMLVVGLWDSSLPMDETEAAALFLSAFSWASEWGLLPVLKEGFERIE